ncbi:30S ribosomal protein S7 [bacterium]|jgi:small subunit ribosomal protein S7|nr:30S ribosomal protein S7 [bacterium]MBT3581178.1 30S ribosomal protein S7 [bacterium]MBT4551612.1 30S ribosomal protein S7 [bacterium]MBT7087625.1 30S ribosomal protein S7 [bacterium]
MSRKKRDYSRPQKGDYLYKNLIIGKFINQLMVDGKKSIAEKIVYNSIDILAEKTKEEKVASFEKAIKHVMPLMEVKSRRVGGSTYQVPIEVKRDRSVAKAIRWVLECATKRNGKSMVEKLSGELLDAYNGVGASMKKREDTHKMADANKAFAHFRW